MYSIENYLNSDVTYSLLSSERSTLGQLSLTTGRGAQNGGTRLTGDSGLGVREHGGDVQTTWALDVQEVRSWALNKSL